MEGASAVTEERVEAVIISGPRKGQIVVLPESDLAPVPDSKAEALIEEMIASAQRMADMARELAADTHELTVELRASRSTPR